MAAGAEQTRAAIAPGSTEYGERGALEAAIGTAVGGGAAPSAGTGGGTAAIPGATDPLGALLSGAVTPQDLPVTDGLTAGPGAGPNRGADPMLGQYAQRLRTLANEAASPMLRQAATRRLSRLSKERV